MELPDAEVLKENLTPRLVNRTVRGVEVLSDELFRSTPRLPSELEGLKAGPIRRRGSYLIITFQGGPRLVLDLAPWAWVWHGSSTYTTTRTTGLRLILDDGMELRVILPGPWLQAAAWVVQRAGQLEALREMGPDPLALGFTHASFRARLEGRRRLVKELLMEPRTVSGIGDAFADEILFAARLSPIRYAHTLSGKEIRRLWEAVPSTLMWAISVLRARLQGALFERELRNFLRVHGRRGSPCPVCGSTVAEIQFDERKTNYCPSCQSS
ncbi:MAG: zinc finger domain-containing protein [Candidatus Bipolaricaulota bacterium]